MSTQEVIAAIQRMPAEEFAQIAAVVHAREDEFADSSGYSVFDLIQDDVGVIASGRGDLSSNPAYLEGFGR